MSIMKLIFILVIFLIVSGCELRARIGEDIDVMNEQEEIRFSGNLRYIKDRKDICYAVLNNKTDGHRNTFTFASVDCVRAGL